MNSKYKVSHTRINSSFISLLSLALLSIFALQCTTGTTPKESEKRQGKQQLIPLEYAENFSVYVEGSDTIIEIKDGKNSWKKRAKKKANQHEVKVPSNTFINLSTSHLYYFNEINGLTGLRAVSFASHLMDSHVAEALENGDLLNLSRGSEYDSELILEIRPELFTTYPFGNNEFSRLENSGIRTLHFTEYTEKHPLGRVEWIKLVGFIIGKEKEAQDYFESVRDAYLLTKIRALAKKSARPKVINANGYQSEWTAPNGNSLVSNFINDAGGDYVFKNDTSSGNLTLDFEKVCLLADSSDYWGSVVFSDEVNLNTFTGGDDRLAKTEVMKRGDVFYCNAQTSDYFGRGVIEPQVMLEDLFHIFHVDSSDYEPIYFQKLAR